MQQTQESWILEHKLESWKGYHRKGTFSVRNEHLEIKNTTVEMKSWKLKWIKSPRKIEQEIKEWTVEEK